MRAHPVLLLLLRDLLFITTEGTGSWDGWFVLRQHGSS